MKAYYSDERSGIEIYCGDCLEIMPHVRADVMVTDPPFGIAYESNHFGSLPRSITGDQDVSLRDRVLEMWGARPTLVMGSWRAPRPADTRMVLIWDSGGALGMGALDLPWKPAHQEIYVLGEGFVGERTSDVLYCPPVQAMASNGRTHPNEKPLGLMLQLLKKCPPGAVLDPFCGSGTTLRAAKELGRKAIGIEIEERYCELAAKRMSQETFQFS